MVQATLNMLGHDVNDEKVNQTLAETSKPASKTSRNKVLGGGGGPRKPRYAPPVVNVKGIKKMKEADRKQVVERLRSAGDETMKKKQAQRTPSC